MWRITGLIIMPTMLTVMMLMIGPIMRDKEKRTERDTSSPFNATAFAAVLLLLSDIVLFLFCIIQPISTRKLGAKYKHVNQNVKTFILLS